MRNTVFDCGQKFFAAAYNIEDQQITPLTEEECKTLSEDVVSECDELQQSFRIVKKVKEALSERGLKNYDADRVEILVQQSDAIVDVIYYACAAAAKTGLNLSPIFEIVHESNMHKVQRNKILYDTRGNVLKPPGWKSPDEKIRREIVRQIQHQENPTAADYDYNYKAFTNYDRLLTYITNVLPRTKRNTVICNYKRIGANLKLPAPTVRGCFQRLIKKGCVEYVSYTKNPKFQIEYKILEAPELNSSLRGLGELELSIAYYLLTTPNVPITYHTLMTYFNKSQKEIKSVIRKLQSRDLLEFDGYTYTIKQPLKRAIQIPSIKNLILDYISSATSSSNRIVSTKRRQN